MGKKRQNTALEKDAQTEEGKINQSNTPPGPGGQLEQLRDILYGNQARSTDERLNRLERSLDSTRQQLNDTFTERLDALRESSQTELSKSQAKFVELLDKQADKHAGQLVKTQTEFDDKLAQQMVDLESTRKEFTSALEQLSADFVQKLNQTQKELSEQLDKLGVEIRDRMQANQEESRQRDDDLRREFLSLGAWLDDKKASRHDLGQMLTEIGQLLQQEKASSTDNLENE